MILIRYWELRGVNILASPWKRTDGVTASLGAELDTAYINQTLHADAWCVCLRERERERCAELEPQRLSLRSGLGTMCTGKCAKCIGVTLYPLAAISILCNILLFFPDWSTRYMKEERVTAEVQYMGGLIGGGVMVLIPAIHIHATGRAGCCANRCGMFLSIAFAAAGVAGALYSFTVAILGLVNGPTCLFSFAGESVWGTPFSVQYYGRNESYLMDRDLWKLCEEPKRVVEFNVALFSILIVAGATELLLCGFQVVNGLFGCLCGTCGSKGQRA
ncbi:transmembrane 4 L6 family member 5 [Acipenser ruthenus]|uniref:transmembrane 4 L6 family member 5 n=1 Tax=Acipenser ruthenus TaxID=7906 RepID=UPI0027420209|nr:transmembrane 4 L6 family member 5 [Acipenser ruthenus]